MAGDWIKIEHVTPEKPEVMYISELLGINENEVLGALVRFWIWCDNQSRDGHAIGVTKIGLDRVTNVTGMFDAMVKAGWLLQDIEGVHIPHFDYHLSQNSKTRALTAKRKQKERHKNVTEMSRNERDKNVTREEKRRELGEESPNNLSCSESKKSTSEQSVSTNFVLLFACSGKVKEWELTEQKITEWSNSFPDLDILAECRKARQWTIDNRKKTARGMPRFLFGWLSKANDSNSRTGFVSAQISKDSSKETFDQKFDRLANELKSTEQLNGEKNDIRILG